MLNKDEETKTYCIICSFNKIVNSFRDMRKNPSCGSKVRASSSEKKMQIMMQKIFNKLKIC